MALALIGTRADSINPREVTIDIGSNSYYEVVLGKNVRRNQHGVRVITSPSSRSGILGPLPETSLGRTSVTLPVESVTEDAEFIQLHSFSSPDRTGPAVSKIEAFTPGLTRSAPTQNRETELTPPAMSRNPLSKGQAMNVHHNASKSFNYRTSLSEPMFLSALTNLLPRILPSVGNLLGGLFLEEVQRQVVALRPLHLTL